MATSIEFMEYVYDQICGAGDVTYKKMFGEYGIYLDGKFIAVVCDNQFFIKPTDRGREVLREVIEAPPYTGAKPYFLIEDLEDKAYLATVLRATFEALPFPKPKKPKAKK